MPMKASGAPTDWREIDRWDGGVGWIAYPDETMQRASHALATDDGVYLVDPVDCDGLDDFVGELGDVVGTVVLLDRHKRDAATVANRHDVPVFLPRQLRGVRSDLDAPVEVFEGRLGGTDYETIELANNAFWKEVALWDASEGTLLVPEAVGTNDYFTTGDEDLGVHPMLRALPPRDELGGLSPERILVGHGDGIHENATAALRDALAGSRKRMFGLYAKTAREMLGV